MKLGISVKTSVLLSLLVSAYGIAGSAAELVGTGSNGMQAVKMGGSSASTPELAAADERVSMSKTKLETARKQLTAAKALLRAAEAEYKASVADKAALALRTEAKQLADASGLKDDNAPVAPLVATPASTEMAGGRIEAPVTELQAAPAPAQLDMNQTPTPVGAN